MATAHTIRFTPEEVAGKGEGLYSDLEVPGDFKATLTKVEDFDNRTRGGSFGWIFHYSVESNKGTTVPMKSYIALSDKARWKVREVLKAHQYPLEELLNLDPESLVGDTVGVHIDFGTDRDTGEKTQYRELQSFFKLPNSDQLELFSEPAAPVAEAGPPPAPAI